MSFILENKQVDPFMADRNSTKSLKIQADLFQDPEILTYDADVSDAIFVLVNNAFLL